MAELTTRLTDLLENLRTKVASVINEQALTVYNHEQLVANISNLKSPAVGVTYMARAANRGAGKESQRGIGADVRFGIYIAGDTLPCKGQDGSTKMASVLDVLDDLKSAITDTESHLGFGHKWKYIADMPANMKTKDGTLIGYMQVWETVQV